MTLLANIAKLLGFAGTENPEHTGEFQFLLGLNEGRYYAVCQLLQGNTLLQELPLFRRKVQQLLHQGYPLTRLVADLRCSCAHGSAKFWTCDVLAQDSLPQDVSAQYVAPPGKISDIDFENFKL